MKYILLLIIVLISNHSFALDVPEEYKKFIYQSKHSKSLSRQFCEKFEICIKTRADFSAAIVIGVANSYINNPLVSTINDAEEVRHFLESELGGFDKVVYLSERDATKERIEYFMETYFPDLFEEKDGGRFLFYFSGHGTLEKANNTAYLWLSDNEFGQRSKAIPMHSVTRWAENGLGKAHHSLFIIDACVSGAAGMELMDGSRDTDTSKIAVDPKFLLKGRDSRILTAGTGTQKAIASEAFNGSVFNKALMEAFTLDVADVLPQDGITTASELSTYVSARVQSLTNNRQTPQPYRAIVGKGHFFLPSINPITNKQKKTVVPKNEETLSSQQYYGAIAKFYVKDEYELSNGTSSTSSSVGYYSSTNKESKLEAQSEALNSCIENHKKGCVVYQALHGQECFAFYQTPNSSLFKDFKGDNEQKIRSEIERTCGLKNESECHNINAICADKSNFYKLGKDKFFVETYAKYKPKDQKTKIREKFANIYETILEQEYREKYVKIKIKNLPIKDNIWYPRKTSFVNRGDKKITYALLVEREHVKCLESNPDRQFDFLSGSSFLELKLYRPLFFEVENPDYSEKELRRYTIDPYSQFSSNVSTSECSRLKLVNYKIQFI
jgi:hypothetical protein